MKISALIIARNEEKKIENTLKSLNFVNEIVVILDRTTDKTESICKKYTKKIFEGSWESEGERRNFGIKNCNYTWILEIDADEIINQRLSLEISNAIKSKSFDYFYIRLVNYVGKKAIKYGWMACMAPDGKFCLFKRKNKYWMNGRVHPSYKVIGRKGKQLENYIIHNMANNISELLKRFNRNTSFNAVDLIDHNYNLEKLFSIRKLLSRFFKCYLARKGFLSGKEGLIISILSAIYPFISAMKAKYDQN